MSTLVTRLTASPEPKCVSLMTKNFGNPSKVCVTLTFAVWLASAVSDTVMSPERVWLFSSSPARKMYVLVPSAVAASTGVIQSGSANESSELDVMSSSTRLFIPATFTVSSFIRNAGFVPSWRTVITCCRPSSALIVSSASRVFSSLLASAVTLTLPSAIAALHHAAEEVAVTVVFVLKDISCEPPAVPKFMYLSSNFTSSCVCPDLPILASTTSCACAATETKSMATSSEPIYVSFFIILKFYQ